MVLYTIKILLSHKRFPTTTTQQGTCKNIFQSCYTLLLKYCKNINNVLFWQLWTYLVAFTKNNNANFDNYLDAKNELHSCLVF